MFSSLSRYRRSRQRGLDKGLTLIELLILLLVLAALAAIVILKVSGNSSDATAKACAQDAATLYASLNNWYLAPTGGNGSFPTPSGTAVAYVAGVSNVPNTSSAYAYTPYVTNVSKAITGATSSGSTITYTGTGFTFTNGQLISVSGFSSSAYDIAGNIANASATSFQITASAVVSPTTAVGTGTALANDLYNLIPTYINKIPPEVTAFLLTTDPNGNPLSTPTVAVTGAQVGCTAGL